MKKKKIITIKRKDVYDDQTPYCCVIRSRNGGGN